VSGLVTSQFDTGGFETAVQYNETIEASHLSRSTLPFCSLPNISQLSTALTLKATSLIGPYFEYLGFAADASPQLHRRSQFRFVGLFQT
jgi:hypothetical protein